MRWLLSVALPLALATPGPVLADAGPATPATVDALTVIGVSPLPGAGLDIDRAPAGVQTLSAADLARGGSASAIGAMDERLAGVSLNDNLANPFQPDVLLHGFEASPVLGTPQGIAVYLNGARINEAFGETVNWDLIPDAAIRRLDVLGANPVFGLNALGGAVVVEMKSGFTDPGGEASISGGSFGRRETTVEYGARSGPLAAYVAARALDEDGWRVASPSRLRSLYADLSARPGRLSLDLGLTAADNRLDGESAAPVQELAVGRSLIFTNPQENVDRLLFITLTGAYAASADLSVQGAAHFRGFWQNVVNGNTTGDISCGQASNLGDLCQGDGATSLTGPGGSPIPDISQGGAVPIGEIDREKVRSDGLGGSLQATYAAPVLDHANRLTAGASLDGAVTRFSSTVEVGQIDQALRIDPGGLFVVTPEGTPFAATPVALRARSNALGVYATDTLNLTSSAAVTASGRFNRATVDLRDGRGAALTGHETYQRFNPALGATWRVGRGATAYAGYSEGSRVPNASEIECSNPAVPCLLPSSLASDPPVLRQVVSRTWEGGVRARVAVGPGVLTGSAGYFRTDVHDDIQAVSTSLSAGYFQNIGGTRREGADILLHFNMPGFTAFGSYSHVAATYRSAFDLPSSSNPFHDAAGNIHVRVGDRLPGIPRDRLKLGADLQPRPGWTVGASLAWVGDQVYRGDESNQLAPLPAYVTLGLHSEFDIGRRLTLFVKVSNALNARYATFGVLGDPTGVGAPGVPVAGQGVDPRFQSPAAPVSAFGGVKMRF